MSEHRNNTTIYRHFCFTITVLLATGILLISNSAGGYFFPSLGLATLLLGSGILYGWFSVPTFLFLAAYAPAFAFPYSHALGGTYVNLMNFELQENIDLIGLAARLSFIAALATYVSLYISFRGSPYTSLSLSSLQSRLTSKHVYIGALMLALTFAWLTDPGPTILTTPYADILTHRYEGTQFAGALAIVAWLFAFVCFINTRNSSDQFQRIRYRWLNYSFWLVTVLVAGWFLLHARRSELLAMVIILLLYLSTIKSKMRAVLLALFALAILQLAGLLRVGNHLGSVDNVQVFLGERAHAADVVSLPGGASNVFMSFAITVDYFSSHAFYFGATFINYIYQLAPSFLYSWLGFSRPPYFHETGVFDSYAWNGGVNAISIFYGNFGQLGIIAYGALLALYVRMTVWLINRSNAILTVIGLFGVGMAVRGLWYEPIVLFKPIVWLGFLFLLMTTGRAIALLEHSERAARQ